MDGLRAFDMEAVEAERVARGLGWAELVAQINGVFRRTKSIPINVGTVQWNRSGGGA